MANVERVEETRPILTTNRLPSFVKQIVNEAREAFKVIEPSGKTYRIYANGEIEGFLPGSIIVNRIPGYAREYHSSMCRALDEKHD